MSSGGNGEAESIPDLFVLRRGLPLEEMERRIGIAYVAAGLKHRVVAFYLHEVQERRLHLLAGFRTTAQYAAARFGMSRREARDLLAAGMALQELPRIDEAFADGRVCWSKVRELIKVATPKHEQAWLEAAQRSPIDELCLAVRTARPGDPPRSPDNRKGLPEVRVKLEVFVPPDVSTKWERVRRLIEAETSEPLAAWEYFDALLDEALARRTGGSGRQGDRPTAGAPRYAVVMHVHAGGPQVETDDGPLPITPLTAELIACGADHFDAMRSDQGTVRDIPEALRRKVFARDHGRCCACRSPHRLQFHHVVACSEGGLTCEENLMLLCRSCHALVHAGLLRITRCGGGWRFEDRQGRNLHDFAMILPKLRAQLDNEGARLVLAEAASPRRGPVRPKRHWHNVPHSDSDDDVPE